MTAKCPYSFQASVASPAGSQPACHLFASPPWLQVNAESSRLCSPLNAAVSRAAALQAAHHSSADALLSCVEVLLEAGADVHHQACDGRTALHSAAGDGSVPCIKLLLRAGAAVDAQDNAGCTPLAVAAASRVPRPHCLLFLLESGAAVTTGELVGRVSGCQDWASRLL